MVPAVIEDIRTKKPPTDPTIAKLVGCLSRLIASPRSLVKETLKNCLSKIIERMGPLRPSQLNDRVIREYAEWRMGQPIGGNTNAARMAQAGS